MTKEYGTAPMKLTIAASIPRVSALNEVLQCIEHMNDATSRGDSFYYGLPGNWRRLTKFRCQVEHLWYRVLWRRSQRRTSWDRYVRLLARFPLPQPHLIAAPVVVAR